MLSQNYWKILSKSPILACVHTALVSEVVLGLGKHGIQHLHNSGCMKWCRQLQGLESNRPAQPSQPLMYSMLVGGLDSPLFAYLCKPIVLLIHSSVTRIRE